MFGSFGIEELFLAAVVAIIIFGKDLPRVLRQIGRLYMRFKTQFMQIRDDITNTLEEEDEQLADEQEPEFEALPEEGNPGDEEQTTDEDSQPDPPEEDVPEEKSTVSGQGEDSEPDPPEEDVPEEKSTVSGQGEDSEPDPAEKDVSEEKSAVSGQGDEAES